MKKIKLVIVILIIAITSILVAAYEFEITNKKYKVGQSIEESKELCQETIENVTKGTVIEQEFVSSYDNLSKLEIVFNPMKEKSNIDGEAVITLIDKETLNEVKRQKISYNDIRENNIYKLQFDKQKNSKNREYIIRIEYVNEDINEENLYELFSIKYTSKKYIENSYLMIDGNEFDGNIAFADYYTNTKKCILFYGAAIAMIAVMTAISLFIYTRKSIKVETVFLYTVPFICILFMVFMPPIKNHDEMYHWFRAYDIAEGHLLAKLPNDEVPFISANIPTGAISVLGEYHWEYFNYSNLVELLNRRCDRKELGYTRIDTSAVYSPIQYIPQALGIFITEKIINSPIIITYGARLFNMICSLAIMYFAIKITPFGKRIFLMLGYIPIVIEGFSSMSPDALTISVAALFIAYVLRLAFDDNVKVEKKQIALLTAMSAILALCKIVYLPLVGLILIIPKEKFGGIKKKWLGCFIIILIATIANFVWLEIASRYLLEFRSGDSKLQVINILKNPIAYLKMLLYTMNKEGYFYFDTMLGGQLGWGGFVKLNFVVPFGLFMLYLISAICDNTIKNKFSKFQNVILFLISASICVLIFTSLYVQWTYIGNEVILGVQGRYFIPFIPLVFIYIGGIRINGEYSEQKLIKYTGIIGMMLQLYVMMELIIANI